VHCLSLVEATLRLKGAHIILVPGGTHKQFFMFLHNILGRRIGVRKCVVETHVGQTETVSCLLSHGTVLCSVNQYILYSAQYSRTVTKNYHVEE
jgi:membrane protease subunit (stomatin/prohibitin family)